MYGLSEKNYKELYECVSKIEFINKVILFGSRARGDYSKTSDIDLAIDVKTHNELLEIIQKLENLDLIYKFDLININTVNNKKLLEKINKEGIIIYSK